MAIPISYKRAVMAATTLLLATSTVLGQGIIKKDPPKQNDPKSNDRRSVSSTQTISPSPSQSAAPSRDPSNNRPANPTPRSLVPRQGVANPSAQTVSPNWNNNGAAQSQRDQRQHEQWQHDQWKREQDDRDRQDRDRDERERRDMLDRRDAASNNNEFNANGYFKGTGVIVSLRPGLFQVKANGSLWRIQPDQFSNIAVVGTAGPDALVPGTVVKFQGNFKSLGNNRLESADPITALEIITPHPGEMPGAITPVPVDSKDVVGPNQQPPPKTIRSLVVVGQVIKCAKGELMLDLAGTTLKADLDPVVAIKLRGSDLSLVHPGDQIDVAGYYVRPGYAMAQDITITLANPIGNPLGEFAKQKPPTKAPNKPIAAQP